MSPGHKASMKPKKDLEPPPLPRLAGIYIFKRSDGIILYIGKAKSLHNRVQSYFQQYKTDWKVNALLEEYATIEHIITTNDTEAALLEAQLIQTYHPKFNVLLREGQPFIYILFTQEELPRMVIVRNKTQKGTYFGPFLQKKDARSAHDFLTKTFALRLCHKKVPNGCLDYHLGYCAGMCRADFDKEDYIFALQLAQNVLKKDHEKFLKDIRKKIALYNAELAFEKAKRLVTYLDAIAAIFHTIQTNFSPEKYLPQITQTTATSSIKITVPENIELLLQDFFKLDRPIVTIDCFDISHFQSQDLVGSCIRFVNGVPEKNKFRRFKIKTLTQQNDYAALSEIVGRRYKNRENYPDLILVDGGKGQLHAVENVVPDVPCASLAKKEEVIYSTHHPTGTPLNIAEPVGKLLIQLRDYAHHFAISYHRLRRTKIR
jgi:excinuclease ABC subunit C